MQGEAAKAMPPLANAPSAGTTPRAGGSRSLKGPKRIAFLIPDFAGGGAEFVTVELANEFALRGYEVQMVVFWASGPNRARLSEKVRVVDLKLSWLYLAPLAIRGYLRRHKPDLVISAMFHTNIFLMAARLLLPFMGTRLVLTEHSMLSLRARHSKRKTKGIFLFAARLLFRFADRVVGVSQGVADDIAAITGLSRGKVTCIYNPVIRADLAGQLSKSLQDPRGGQAALPRIVTAGRLEPEKDHATMIRAFAKLLESGEARLLILGEGSLRPRLEQLTAALGIAGQVEFAGYVDDPGPHFRSADLFVLSSIYEGLPTVLIEALSFGLPVVSTDCPSGPREILADGAFGRLVPPGDATALAAAMLDSLKAEADPQRQLTRALDFTVERSVDEYERLAAEVCGVPA